MNPELQMAYGLIDARVHSARDRAQTRDLETARAAARRTRRLQRRRSR